MGKAVPKGIKSKAGIILKEMPESFDSDFEKNKKNIRELNLPFTKWTRNVMAGYITRTKKKQIIAIKKIEEARKKITTIKPKEMEPKQEEAKKTEKQKEETENEEEIESE